ncbi:hypothetical protein RHGRI_021310 [Rhododendron griersonianum]|uniref:Lipoxygenase domain-containing protein n=1 Tax=Rhododendron griersonianum TaxID=479676 RepID=A0AAV6JNQ0_9ERIC|nr:hypothetical protein RHGRI_021310 [Rhododendron griersonianum]
MTDLEPLEAFDRFGIELGEIKDEIVEMNSDGKLRSRVGLVKMPYTLLCPTIQDGLTGTAEDDEGKIREGRAETTTPQFIL